MSIINNRKIEGVREYSEEMDVEIAETVASEFSNAPSGRKIIVGYNQAGHDFVQIDFEDLKTWITEHPEGI